MEVDATLIAQSRPQSLSSGHALQISSPSQKRNHLCPRALALQSLRVRQYLRRSRAWILYQLSFVKQEGSRDTTEERMLTLIINQDVLTRTGEKNIEWLRSLFLDKWLDYSLSSHWRISQLRGVEEMLGEHSA